MKPKSLTKRDPAITTHEEKARARAYGLYELGGRIDGHAGEDWLQAEAEMAGRSLERRRSRGIASTWSDSKDISFSCTAPIARR